MSKKLLSKHCQKRLKLEFESLLHKTHVASFLHHVDISSYSKMGPPVWRGSMLARNAGGSHLLLGWEFDEKSGEISWDRIGEWCV